MSGAITDMETLMQEGPHVSFQHVFLMALL